MKQTVYIMVHCESYYNKQGIFTGHVDSTLTPLGHEHAGHLAEELKDTEIAVAYRSSLTRTKQTLDHILKYHPKTHVVVDDRIIERDYGELSSIKKEEYKERHPKLYPIYLRSYDVPPPGGESIKQVEQRVIPFIKDILQRIKRENINVLIVAHGNSIRPIRRLFEDLTIDEMMSLETQRDRVFTYEIDVDRKLELLESR